MSQVIDQNAKTALHKVLDDYKAGKKDFSPYMITMKQIEAWLQSKENR